MSLYAKLKQYPIVSAIVKGLRLSTSMIDKMPEEDDTRPTKVVKAFSIADSIYREFVEETDSVFKTIKTLNVDSINNQLIRDLFFNTSMGDGFALDEITISDYTSIVGAHNDNGSLFFVRRDWGATPSYEDDFYFSKGFNFDKMISDLWAKYNNKIHLEYNFDDKDDRSKPRVSSIVDTKFSLLGNGKKILDNLVKNQKVFFDKGISRTYCFAGKPGTGKSSVAIRFAEQSGQRILRIDAQELKILMNGLVFFIKTLQPDFIIFDDFDRADGLDTYLSRMLTLIQDIKVKFPGVVTIFTVNDLTTMDEALLRPGRMDEIVDFDMPSADDRESILDMYLKQFDVDCSSNDLDQLVLISESLSPAHLKEIAIRKQISSTDDVIKIINRMKELGLAKEKKAKNETGAVEWSPPMKY